MMKIFCAFFVLVHVILFISHNEATFLRKSHHTSTTTVRSWLNKINSELLELNRQSAGIAWTMMSDGDPDGRLQQRGSVLGAVKTKWKNQVCDSLIDLEPVISNNREKRMVNLLCRGPKYSKEQVRELSEMMDDMSAAYSSAEVCVPKDSWLAKSSQNNSTAKKVCLKGEPDLENLMTLHNLSSEQLLWIWKSWHDTVGPVIKQYYPRLVTVLNEAAVNNGYNDIGEIWRDELEIPNLENVVKKIYNEIHPLYVMLHAVIRHALVKKYGPEVVDPVGFIPSHLLGNMWAQDWSSLSSLLIPEDQNLNLNDHILMKNWTVNEMVMLAEDMYVSMGLPKLTQKFWKYSKFEKNDKKSSLCHGTAANMFDKDDFRILLCAKPNMEDFYIIHHEIGHIEYYMAYKDQPAIFQDETNSALQESIGDSIMTGVMAPQHLHRLGLITDQQLLDKNLDIILLLQQALAKIPQIPFALIIDQYRWEIFEGKIKPEEYNRKYWLLNKRLRGVAPPEPRDENYFDAGAKFHIPDNTPYIRYFLSAILQLEMFQGMCELTIFGKSPKKDTNIPFPLHRCDIYGSKKAGTKLKQMMTLGGSEHWSKSLGILTGKTYISVKPLLKYYEPVKNWLRDYIVKHNVSVGW